MLRAVDGVEYNLLLYGVILAEYRSVLQVCGGVLLEPSAQGILRAARRIVSDISARLNRPPRSLCGKVLTLRKQHVFIVIEISIRALACSLRRGSISRLIKFRFAVSGIRIGIFIKSNRRGLKLVGRIDYRILCAQLIGFRVVDKREVVSQHLSLRSGEIAFSHGHYVRTNRNLRIAETAVIILLKREQLFRRQRRSRRLKYGVRLAP